VVRLLGLSGPPGSEGRRFRTAAGGGVGVVVGELVDDPPVGFLGDVDLVGGGVIVGVERVEGGGVDPDRHHAVGRGFAGRGFAGRSWHLSILRRQTTRLLIMDDHS
jgi:hypothetical protein